MTASSLVEIGVSKEIRTERLVKEYGDADPEKFLEAMTKISKKLGGQHYKTAKEKLLEGGYEFCYRCAAYVL